MTYDQNDMNAKALAYALANLISSDLEIVFGDLYTSLDATNFEENEIILSNAQSYAITRLTLLLKKEFE